MATADLVNDLQTQQMEQQATLEAMRISLWVEVVKLDRGDTSDDSELRHLVRELGIGPEELAEMAKAASLIRGNQKAIDDFEEQKKDWSKTLEKYDLWCKTQGKEQERFLDSQALYRSRSAGAQASRKRIGEVIGAHPPLRDALAILEREKEKNDVDTVQTKGPLEPDRAEDQPKPRRKRKRSSDSGGGDSGPHAL